jgi:hypothetical protein
MERVKERSSNWGVLLDEGGGGREYFNKDDILFLGFFKGLHSTDSPFFSALVLKRPKTRRK